MTLDFDKLFQTAEKVANKSSCLFRVSCILVDKRGRIVATGYNHHSTHRTMGQYVIHAEMDALNKVRKPSTNLVALLYRANNKIITPCTTCQELLKAYGIQTVWHTAGKTEECNIIQKVVI